MRSEINKPQMKVIKGAEKIYFSSKTPSYVLVKIYISCRYILNQKYFINRKRLGLDL